MIDQSTIDRIMGAANIVDVVSEYVTLRRSGASYKGLCPFHDDKTPSFYVNPARGICKCFSCGKGGNVVHFVMEQEQLSYVEALRFLGKKYGIEVQEKEYTPEERRSQNERESMFALNEWASGYFHDTMLRSGDGRAVGLAYFRSRGFRDDIIEKFRLGFATDSWDALSAAAQKAGYRPDYLVKTGLSIRRDNGSLIDKFRGRAIFPWFTVSGKVVAFGGRVLDARTKGVSQKYINSPESEVFHKSNELYGIFQAKKQIVKDDRVYMVEGYTDVISMHQCGIENVVANSGTALNEAQIRLLRRFTSNITLLYDGDEAGIHAALRGTDMLLAEGMNVKVMLLPDGDDPDSFARKHTAAEFRDHVERRQTDFILFKANLLLAEAGSDPRKRSELASSILRSISVIADEIVRASYVHECAELMRMDEQMLLRQCLKMRRDYIQQRRLEREREAQRQQHTARREAQAGAPPAAPDSGAAHPAQPAAADAQPPLRPVPDDVPPMGAEAAAPPSPADGTDAPPQPHPAPPATDDERLIGLERLIMRLVVRYGEQPIEFAGAEGTVETCSVIDFVHNELAIDGLALRSPLYAAMLADARAHLADEAFLCSRHFVNSPDMEVSREASELLSDRYRLSQSDHLPSEKERLGAYISHLLLDYKYNIIRAELRQATRQLADPAVVADPAQCDAVLQRQVRLSAVMRKLAHVLGDRVISQ